MSRIGRMPVAIPAGVTVTIAENNLVTVKGPKGTLERELPVEMSIKEEDGHIIVTRPNDLKKMKSLHGLTRTLINNMMPNMAAFLCYLKGLSPKKREAFAFGSYGWGGQSVAQVEEELVKCGFNICMDKIRIQYVPTKEQLLEIESKVEALVS